jgi:hypothetical protein
MVQTTGISLKKNFFQIGEWITVNKYMSTVYRYITLAKVISLTKSLSNVKRASVGLNFNESNYMFLTKFAQFGMY